MELNDDAKVFMKSHLILHIYSWNWSIMQKYSIVI